MLKKIYQLFEKTNIYGLDFHLLYKKEENYSTLFDIFLSIISIVILLFISFTYLKDFFYKTGFSVVTNSIQLKEKTPIDLSNTSIIFGISNYQGAMIDFDNSYVNYNLYKTEHNYNIYNKKILNRTQNEIKLEKCSENILNNFFYENVNSRYNISKFLCISKDQNLTIAGRYSDIFTLFDILEFHISKCENKTKNKNCKNEDEINLYLSNTYIHVIYLSYFINHFNVTHPINDMISSNGYMISLNSVKRYYFYLSPSLYISENGLIFNSQKIYKFFEPKETFLDYIDKEQFSYFSSQTLMEITFTVYPYEFHYNRRYVKLQDALGDIGGCTDLLFIIFKLISTYFSEKSFIIEISNSFINKNKIIKNKKRAKNIFKKNEKESNIKIISTSVIKNCSSNKLKVLNNESANQLNQKEIYNIGSNNYVSFSIKNINNSMKTLNNFKINSSKKVISKTSTNSFKKIFDYSIFDYCLPFFLMKKMNHKDIIYCYEKIFKKYMSIDVMIPLLERMSMNMEIANKSNFYFKFNSILLQNSF